MFGGLKTSEVSFSLYSDTLRPKPAYTLFRPFFCNCEIAFVCEMPGALLLCTAKRVFNTFCDVEKSWLVAVLGGGQCRRISEQRTPVALQEKKILF